MCRRHLIIEDFIDIDLDRSMTIYYCSRCYKCFDSLQPWKKSKSNKSNPKKLSSINPYI